MVGKSQAPQPGALRGSNLAFFIDRRAVGALQGVNVQVYFHKNLIFLTVRWKNSYKFVIRKV
jgi:hypothetical protein